MVWIFAEDFWESIKVTGNIN